MVAALFDFFQLLAQQVNLVGVFGRGGGAELVAQAGQLFFVMLGLGSGLLAGLLQLTLECLESVFLLDVFLVKLLIAARGLLQPELQHASLLGALHGQLLELQRGLFVFQGQSLGLHQTFLQLRQNDFGVSTRSRLPSGDRLGGV